jgi:kynurenine formamidase
MRLYDLSLSVAPNASEPTPVRIDYVSHQIGAGILGQPIGLDAREWPDEIGLSTEQVSLTTHTSTHLDAPLHYGPTCQGGASKSIEEIPLDWLYRPGVVLRCRDGFGPITVLEIQTELERIGYAISPLDIVLIDSGAAHLWGADCYFTDFRGMSVEGTEWLTGRGVKVIGIDSFGFDPPFHRMLADYERSRNPAALWPAHVFGRHREYCQIERLANLESLPAPFGFTVICFPIKVHRAGAGWVRVVAAYNE